MLTLRSGHLTAVILAQASIQLNKEKRLIDWMLVFTSMTEDFFRFVILAKATHRMWEMSREDMEVRSDQNPVSE